MTVRETFALEATDRVMAGVSLDVNTDQQMGEKHA
ncbi:hypothetical protein FHX34_102875 [Actinoplanes teichomyceticus]|uniref:Uncharacterized protein n=1 Tax=Actinoplanes teichomyceticus TaxID=1867 RepID=A0A561WKC9_ACTTI|nr:hypothetical protein FHX34_102875 [Actinoplanes teichomyceticus]